MTPENFVYWLQGFFELSEEKTLSPLQVQAIKDHLALVLNKQTPARNLLQDGSIYRQPTGHGILSC
jgi:hypothetical protein